MRWPLALVVSLACATAAGAAAQDRPCGAAVHAWVARAGAANDARLSARACPGERVIVAVVPEGAAPYDVEIARCGARPAFRTIAASDGGPALCVSPRMVVADFSQLPAAQVTAFEQLAAWIDTHARDVRLPSGALPPTLRTIERFEAPAAGAPWLLALAALAAAFALGLARRAGRVAWSPRALASAAALFALGLGLRLALGGWAPHHVHLGALWISAATVDPGETFHYGPGYAELFGWLVALAPGAPDHALYAINAAVGAALAPLALALARLAGLDRWGAIAVALVLACDPVAVRFGATESYLPILMLCAASTAALAAAAARLHDHRAAAALCVLAAALVAAQQARVHPMGWTLLAIAPLVALAPPVPRRARLLAAVAVGVAIAIAVAAIDGAIVVRVLRAIADGEIYRSPVVLRPLALVGVALASAVWALAPGSRGLALAGGSHTLVWALTRDGYAQSALWQSSYDRLHLVVPLVATVALVSAPRARLSLGLAAALLALAVARDHDALRAPADTASREHALLRAWMRALPERCHTVHVGFAGRYGAFLPTYAAPPRPRERFVRLDGRRDVDVRAALGDAQCVYYVRTSLCATAPGARACGDVEAQLARDHELRLETTWSLPAIPAEDYERASVEISVSRAR